RPGRGAARRRPRPHVPRLSVASRGRAGDESRRSSEPGRAAHALPAGIEGQACGARTVAAGARAPGTARHAARDRRRGSLLRRAQELGARARRGFRRAGAHGGGVGGKALMRVRAGTSGWSYPEWKKHFYPEKIATKDMLRYYGEHFSTVEVNNTFHR